MARKGVSKPRSQSQQPSLEESRKRALHIIETEVKGLRPKDLKMIAGYFRERLTVTLAFQVSHTLDKKPRGIVSPKNAEKIMGKGNYFGPEAVEKVFRVKLSAMKIPEIPFPKQDLEKAKGRGQMLILRVDRASDEAPLTMEKMNGGSNLLFHNMRWCQGETFFTHETPRVGWALVSKTILPKSTKKNDLQQTELLAQELRKVFEGNTLPPDVKKALEDFEKQKGKIAEHLIHQGWGKAADMLSELDLNKLFRRSPVEIVYDLVTVFGNTGERLLGNRSERTSRLYLRDNLVILGDFGFDGVSLSYWIPDGDISDLGVSFSRSQ